MNENFVDFTVIVTQDAPRRTVRVEVQTPEGLIFSYLNVSVLSQSLQTTQLQPVIDNTVKY